MTPFPSSYALYRAARAHRSFELRETIGAAIRSVGAMARRALARYLQRRQMRLAYMELGQLDDRMLRDLGLDRSEIMSMAAELSGEAEPTRVRAVRTLQNIVSVRPAATPSGIGDAAMVARVRNAHQRTRWHQVSMSPRIGLSVAALALAAITFAVLVIAPASVETDEPERATVVSARHPQLPDPVWRDSTLQGSSELRL